MMNSIRIQDGPWHCRCGRTELTTVPIGLCARHGTSTGRPFLTATVRITGIGSVQNGTQADGSRYLRLDPVVTKGFTLGISKSILEIYAIVSDSPLADQVLENPRMGMRLGWVSLLASTSTWICCALPILLVTMGAGATLAGITRQIPLLTDLAVYKNWMFAISSILLVTAAGLTWRSGLHCPTDPVLAQQCERVRRWNKIILWVSMIVWSIGFLAAYLALPVRMYLDQQ